jgi:hypothetical protein
VSFLFAIMVEAAFGTKTLTTDTLTISLDQSNETK